MIELLLGAGRQITSVPTDVPYMGFDFSTKLDLGAVPCNIAPAAGLYTSGYTPKLAGYTSVLGNVSSSTILSAVPASGNKWGFAGVFTLEFWFKPNAFDMTFGEEYFQLQSSNLTMTIGFGGSSDSFYGHVNISAGPTGISSNRNINLSYNNTTNKWCHIAVTFDGSVFRVYANGDLLTTTTRYSTSFGANTIPGDTAAVDNITKIITWHSSQKQWAAWALWPYIRYSKNFTPSTLLVPPSA